MRSINNTERRFTVALIGVSLAIVTVAGGGARSKVVPFREVDDGATTIAELRERPVELPHLGHHDECPIQPSVLIAGAGLTGTQSGPVAAVIEPEGDAYFSVPSTGDQQRAVGKILWLVQADQPALLARGRQIDGNGSVRFGDDNAKELVLDQDATSTVGPGWRDQPSSPSIPRSGCYAVQIDGPDFQSVIVFRAEAFGATAVQSTRSVDVKDLQLEEGQSLKVSLHPSSKPIEIDTPERDVEVCPSGWPGSAGFVECLPVDADGHATLPSTKSNTYHLGFIVQGINGKPVDISRLMITYELVDGYFMFHPPPIESGGTSARFVVTPTRRASIGVDPFPANGNQADPEARPVIHQGGRWIQLGGISTGHGETYGPLTLDRPVVLTVRNIGSMPMILDLLVDWN